MHRRQRICAHGMQVAVAADVQASEVMLPRTQRCHELRRSLFAYSNSQRSRFFELSASFTIQGITRCIWPSDAVCEWGGGCSTNGYGPSPFSASMLASRKLASRQ